MSEHKPELVVFEERAISEDSKILFEEAFDGSSIERKCVVREVSLDEILNKSWNHKLNVKVFIEVKK